MACLFMAIPRIWFARACLTRHDARSKAVGCRFPLVRRVPDRRCLLTVPSGRGKPPWCRAPNLVEVAALVGDTARATILAALMGGQALTGSELAYLARVSRPTASEHLLKLVEARLVAVTKQGRYRYYRIASPLVARMLESIIA